MPEITMKIGGLNETMRMLKEVETFLKDTQPMQNIVDDVKDIITNKTAQGKDYLGQNFKPYSKEYAKSKHRGRRQKMAGDIGWRGVHAIERFAGIGSGTVDLRQSGTMMNSITGQVINANHGKVEVRGHTFIAQLHNKGGTKSGRPPIREFMNLSKSAIKDLQKKYFDDPLMKLLGRK